MNGQAFLDRTLACIDKYQMIRGGDAVVVAVSGGPDSTALLISLWRLAPRLEIDLHVWHLNHLIRPEAAAEADGVKRLAAKCGLPVTIDRFDVKNYARSAGLSLQVAGRNTRYRLLKQAGESLGGAKIAVGHNAEDSVETFFINLLRGSGLSGLRGIPPVSGSVVRPLIETRRAEIIDYLKATKTEYIADPSNLDQRYLRNRIRAELLPVLRKLSSDPVRKVSDTTALLRDDEALLAELADREFADLAAVIDGEVKLSAARLFALPAALKRRVVRLAADNLIGVAGSLDHAAINSIIEKTATGGGATNLPGGLKAALCGGELILGAERAPFASKFVPAAGGEIKIDHSTVSVTIASSSTAAVPPPAGWLAVDADKIEWPLEIRARHDGDWFFPLGLGGKKKLHDFFIDKKIPRHHRNAVPIFSDKTKLIAVGNMRIDDRVKVDHGTKKIALLKAPDIIA